MNPISDKIHTGTLGELLVQIRLLQHGVQAAPPLKDSGYDLIAVRREVFRAVSVRTTTNGRFSKPRGERLYHVLAVVRLRGEDRDIHLDNSSIFLIPHDAVDHVSNHCDRLEEYRFTGELVERLFCERAG